MIKHIRGAVEINKYIAPASTAFDFNDVVTYDSNGRLALATATTPRSKLLGLIQKAIASTDDDYTSTKIVPVLEFNEEAEFEATVDTGTAVQSMVRKAFDLNDEDGVDVTAELQKCFWVMSILSTTLVRGRFITDGDAMGIQTYQQTVVFGDFTDSTGVTGTLELNVSIPVGAVFLRTLLTVLTGFAGDTTATITIGDGSDVDRYMTGTPDVFSTVAAGLDMGAPAGTMFHGAAKTPKIIVTVATDWGAVTAGGFTVTLFWYQA